MMLSSARLGAGVYVRTPCWVLCSIIQCFGCKGDGLRNRGTCARLLICKGGKVTERTFLEGRKCETINRNTEEKEGAYFFGVLFIRE